MTSVVERLARLRMGAQAAGAGEFGAGEFGGGAFGHADVAVADYCTLADVKLWLASALPDTAQDATLAARIAPASRLIDRVAGLWPGGFAPLDATRDVDVTAELTPRPTAGLWDAWGVPAPAVVDPCASGGAVAVRVPPLLAAAQVLADDDGRGTFGRALSEGTDFVLDPTWGVPYRQLTLRAATATGGFALGQRRLRIAGTWGVAWAVPAEITQLCIELVARKWKRAEAPFGIAGSPETGVLRVPSDEDYATQALKAMGYAPLAAAWVLA